MFEFRQAAPDPVSATPAHAAPPPAVGTQRSRALQMGVGLAEPAGVQSRKPRAHDGVEFVFGKRAIDARQTLRGRHVAGVALEHIGKQVFCRGQILGRFSVLGIHQRWQYTASGGHLAQPLGGFVVAGFDLECGIKSVARILELARLQRAFAGGLRRGASATRFDGIQRPACSVASVLGALS